MSPASTADQREQGGLGQELSGDVAPGGAERATQADLATSLQHRDHHDVRDADRAHEQGDGAEAEEEAW